MEATSWWNTTVCHLQKSSKEIQFEPESSAGSNSIFITPVQGLSFCPQSSQARCSVIYWQRVLVNNKWSDILYGHFDNWHLLTLVRSAACWFGAVAGLGFEPPTKNDIAAEVVARQQGHTKKKISSKCRRRKKNSEKQRSAILSQNGYVGEGCVPHKWLASN